MLRMIQPHSLFPTSFTPNKKISAKRTTLSHISTRAKIPAQIKHLKKGFKESWQNEAGFCKCNRRHFIEAFGTALLPINNASSAAESLSNYPMTMLDRIHPPRPDWYEEFYASAMDKTMMSYEAEIAGYKSQLFSNLRGNILEIGIGTGPNLKYYAKGPDVCVYGVDPNRKMKRYALEAAKAAGMPSENFKFKQAVAEALPVDDASLDVVIGTLVLCSVEDVDLVLQEIKRVLKPGGKYLFVEHVAAEDGTALKFFQGLLDPLQQFVADGCHLTKKTGVSILNAGFSTVNLHNVFLSSASLINPHVYGVANK